jgi:hypothetical protein
MNIHGPLIKVYRREEKGRVLQGGIGAMGKGGGEDYKSFTGFP